MAFYYLKIKFDIINDKINIYDYDQYAMLHEVTTNLAILVAYISIHPTDNSVSFIKQYTEKVSVAIKISTDGKLGYRTMYPLDEKQLIEYMENGRAWKFKEIV